MQQWILRISYLDEFHTTYISFVYLHHAHNNPTFVYMAQVMVDIANHKKEKRYIRKLE